MIPVTTTFDGISYITYNKGDIIKACRRVGCFRETREDCLKKDFLNCDDCYMELCSVDCKFKRIPIGAEE